MNLLKKLHYKTLSQRVRVFRNNQVIKLYTSHSETHNFVVNKLFREHTMNSGVRDDNSWRGVPLSEIQGSESPWGAPEFPLVTPSYNHAVLYHVPNEGCLAGDRPPKPQMGQDKWDHEHVRMPCSSQSLYPIEDSNGEIQLKKRWKMIENVLSKPIRNTHELADAILSYNTKFKKIWKFQALHKLFNEHLEEEESLYFFDVTLPDIAKLALALPRLIQCPIPLLKQRGNRSISLSQQQIASLLANAFFCTFPRRNTTKKVSEYATYPHINFNPLYESSGSDCILEKLKCLCHYFRRVCTKVPVGVVTFSRRSVEASARPAWLTCDASIASLPVHVDSENTIEDAHGLIQVDFANKYLGGGVLGHGCVQEEIRFVICPELMISMLFTEFLKPNEAVMIIGCERYSKYGGYGSTFHWAGEYREGAPRDSSGRRRCAVLALDALPYSTIHQEFRREPITRELDKAWVGFSMGASPQSVGLQHPGVATGNWGCGAFGASPHLKSLVQLMAGARARRPLAYYTFGDTHLRDDIVNVYNLLARYNVTVGQLYRYLVRFCQTDVRGTQLHAFLHQVLRDEDRKSPKDNPELMVTSTSSETSQLELSSSLQNEFLRDGDNSPDMFTQDDVSLIEVKIDANVTEHDTEPICSEKMEDKNVTSHTSKLFEEMQRLDDENGSLNLSMPHTSPLKQSVDLSVDDTEASMDDKALSDPKTELKKRISKKITDYFSKKPV